MAQTPWLYVNEGDTLDYLASADKLAGEAVVIGGDVFPVARAIDYSENPLGALHTGKMWDIPQAAEVIAAGTKVYWDADGNPYGGTAGSGCATATSSSNTLIGVAAPVQPNGTTASAATDSYIRVARYERGINIATIAGSVTCDDITGSDPILTITGAVGSSSAGGTVPITGGAGNGAGYAGGAQITTGGAGVAAAAGTGGAGGAVSRVGGAAGGDTTGTGGAGGAADSTGGAGGACSGAGTGGAGGSALSVGGVGGAAVTTGTGGVGGSIAGTAGVGGASGAGGTGGVGGSASRTAGAGGACTTTGNGGVGGAALSTSGAGGASATSGTGGASGACGLASGVGGATATGTGGRGTDITIGGGAGGAASGNGTGGAGANVVVTPGAGGTSGTGTAGVIGCIRNVGLATVQQGAPATETNTATTTIAKLLSGVLEVTPTAACTLTLPTGTNMTTFNQLAVGDSFDWYIINLSTAANTDIITVTANTDHTLVGVMKVQSAEAGVGGLTGTSSAHFRSRKTAATTWITYRLG